MKNFWSRRTSGSLEGVESMVYASRLIGADPSLVLWGGGNTSIKVEETDFKGDRVRVLRVKGSGSDLKSIQPKDFAGVRLDEVLPLRQRRAMADEEMVAYVTHCVMSPKDPRPSIEVLLHAFIPHSAVIHTHADAILSLTNTPQGRHVVSRVFGEHVGWVPYQRPGFGLSKVVGQLAERSPALRGIVLEKHGVITWGGNAKEAYQATVTLVSEAEEYIRKALRAVKHPFGKVVAPPLSRSARQALLPVLATCLRGALSAHRRVILGWDRSPKVMEFVCAGRAKALAKAGPGTPDHLLSIKRMPMWLGLPKAHDGASVQRAVSVAVDEYTKRYTTYVKAQSNGSRPPVDPTPRVVLVPGVGMLTAGKDIRAARIAAEVYAHTIAIMRNAQALGGYRSISDHEAYEVEYWPMELYKLTLAPQEQEFSRKVVMVTGGASGIGKAVVQRLAEAGAHVVIADVDKAGSHALARALNEQWKMERALSVPMDVSDEASVARGFASAAVTYGGVDIVVSNAGVAGSSSVEHMPLQQWERNFKVNSTGHFLVSREAVRIMRRQQRGGVLIFIASKNVLAPGKDFAAYSASKAAETQLARIVAIENGIHGIRVNIVNPDAVFQDSKLWSPAVRAQRARAQGIRADEIEEHYRRRNLLQVGVAPQDVAEAVLFLASERAAKTTGCLFPVDGGLREAFPR